MQVDTGAAIQLHNSFIPNLIDADTIRMSHCDRNDTYRKNNGCQPTDNKYIKHILWLD